MNSDKNQLQLSARMNEEIPYGMMQQSESIFATYVAVALVDGIVGVGFG